MDAPPAPLPDDVPKLQRMVRELLATVAELRRTAEAQQARIDDLTRRLYGRRSERIATPPPPPSTPAPPPPAAPPPRRGHGRRPLPGHLPRERVEHDLGEAVKACPGCGRVRVRIGSEASEQLDYRPASVVVVEHVRHTSTLGGWVHAAAELLEPVVSRMGCRVRASRVIRTDDTPVPLLRKGAGTTAAHLWAYLGDAGHPYCVFDFTPGYSGDGPKAWLGDYAGYVQADALKQYDPLFDRPPPRPTEVGCRAHARRKFHDARASDPARGHEALARIRAFYEVEAEAKGLDDASQLAARRARSRPVLDALFGWLEAERPKVRPKSPMAAAIRYALGNRAALTRYTDTGFLAIDNNASERALRAVAVGRGNWTFVGSPAGGRTAAVLYSVTGTCRRLGLDPWAYLRDAFTRRPVLPADRLDELLPDRWAAARARVAA